MRDDSGSVNIHVEILVSASCSRCGTGLFKGEQSMKLSQVARVVGLAVFAVTASGCGENLPSDEEIKSLIRESNESQRIFRQTGRVKWGEPISMGCTPEIGSEFDREIQRLIKGGELQPSSNARFFGKAKENDPNSYIDKNEAIRVYTEFDKIRSVSVRSHTIDFVGDLDKKFNPETGTLTVEYLLGAIQTDYGKKIMKFDFGKNNEQECLKVHLVSKDELKDLSLNRITLEEWDSGWRIAGQESVD